MDLKSKLYIIVLIFIGEFFTGCSFNSDNKYFPYFPAVKKEQKISLYQIITDTSIDLISKTEWGSGSFAIDNNDVVPLKIKGRGNSSWRMPKKCYTIKFDEKQSILKISKAKKWVLVSNYADKSLLRNKFTYDLGNQIFDNLIWTPSFDFCEITFNDEYLGSYIIGEKIEIGKERLNIQNIEDIEQVLENKNNKNLIDENQDNIIDLYDGGFIVEINVHLDENRNFITSRGVKISLKDPDDISETTWDHIKSIIQRAEDELYSETSNDIFEYFDIHSLVDWYIINEFAKNVDADFFTSVYMYYNPKDEKFHMGPIWDFDYGYGNINSRTCDSPIGWYINQTSDHSECNYYTRIFENAQFRVILKNRWNKIKSDLHSSVNNHILELEMKLKKSAKRNFERWKILGIKSWQDADGYEERTTWESEVDYFIDFCNKRYEWMEVAINEL